MNIREIGDGVLDYCRELGWAGLETGISRPVPRVEAGETQIWYLLYRSQVRVPYQILYAPFAHVGANYPSGQVIAYTPLSDTDPTQPLGHYPHDAAKAIPPDKWNSIWDELFSLYPTVIAAFANGEQLAGQHEIARFVQLFDLTVPPFMLEYYRGLNPTFFDWLDQEQVDFKS